MYIFTVMLHTVSLAPLFEFIFRAFVVCPYGKVVAYLTGKSICVHRTFNHSIINCRVWRTLPVGDLPWVKLPEIAVMNFSSSIMPIKEKKYRNIEFRYCCNFGCRFYERTKRVVGTDFRAVQSVVNYISTICDQQQGKGISSCG